MAQYEKDTGKSAKELSGGDWHHRNDGKGGTGMEYVDKKIHGPLHHEGSVKAGKSQEF